MATLLVGSLFVVLLAYMAVRANPTSLSGAAVAVVDCVVMLCSVAVLSGILAWGLVRPSLMVAAAHAPRVVSFALPQADAETAAHDVVARAL